MVTTITPETRLIDLTVGQLLELIKSGSSGADTPKQETSKRHVYGIAGIAQIFNCSIATANRIKKSGRIDGAIRQSGRIIVIDAERALELFNETK